VPASWGLGGNNKGRGHTLSTMCCEVKEMNLSDGIQDKESDVDRFEGSN